jgi:hypothetical protein
MQTEDQAKDIDKELKDMLIQYDLKLYELDADKFAAGRLLPDILFLLEQKKVAWEIQDDPYEDGK